MNVADRLVCLVLAALVLQASGVVVAQDHGTHDHEGHGESQEPVERPQVFLDKSPRVVQFQLKRLDNRRLLLVETKTDDPKYLPVFEAILLRDGIPDANREEALAGVVVINESGPIIELLRVLALVESDGTDSVTADLIEILMKQPDDRLTGSLASLSEAAKATENSVRVAGFAGIIGANKAEDAVELAEIDSESRIDFLRAISMVPNESARLSLRETVLAMIDESQPVDVRRAAITAMSSINVEQADTFARLAALVEDESLRVEAISTMLTLSRDGRDPEIVASLLGQIVEMAEMTPAAQRTSEEFIDAMELADQLLPVVPTDEARAYRARLSEVSVRVVRIRTVEEEMRYDIPYFAVQAGKSVQVLLENDDLMSHNLVITQIDGLREVADLAGLMSSTDRVDGKQYVPDSSLVLFATGMVQPHESERLTFSAPTEPGEYPFVCTFPGHWMRMYGVMVVVDDLDSWLQNPIEPADPIGNTRSFVKKWTVEELVEGLDAGIQARNREIGSQIFKAATCAQCHKMNGEGGEIGPDLAGLLERFESDRAAIIREIIEPSHRIEPKYSMQTVVTLDGQVISGILTAETDEEITLIENPENPKPIVILQDDIDEMIQSNKSMMPKALLDWFTEDEIYELLAYILQASE